MSDPLTQEAEALPQYDTVARARELAARDLREQGQRDTARGVVETAREIAARDAEREAERQRVFADLEVVADEALEQNGFFTEIAAVGASALEQSAEGVVNSSIDLGDWVLNSVDPEGTNPLFGGPQVVRRDWLNTAADVLDRDLGDGMDIPFTPYTIVQIANQQEYRTLLEAWETTGEDVYLDLPDADRPDSTTGQVSEAILRWAIIFAATRKAVGGGGSTASRGAQFAHGMGAGAYADFAAFDPHEARLSDLLIQVGEGNPMLDNAITQYLASDPDDTAMEGRFKNLLEGAGLGAAIEGVIFAGSRWLRSYRAQKELLKEGDRTVAEVADDAVPDEMLRDADQADRTDDLISGTDDAFDADEALDEILDGADEGLSPDTGSNKYTVDDLIYGTDEAVREADHLADASDDVAEEVVEGSEGVVRETDEAVDDVTEEAAEDLGDEAIADEGISRWETAEFRLSKSPRQIYNEAIAEGASRALARKAARIQLDEGLRDIRIRSEMELSREDAAALWVTYARPSRGAIEQFSELVKKGELSQAEDLIEFNSSKVDWDAVGKSIDEDSDTIRRLINTTSETFKDYMDVTLTRTQTLAMTSRLAKSIGGSAEQVLRLFSDISNGEGLAARLFAAQSVLLASAQRLRQLAKRASKDGATMKDEAAFLEHIEMHAQVQATVKGSQSEIARALHAMRQQRKATEGGFQVFDEINRNGYRGLSMGVRRALAMKLAKENSLFAINNLTRRSMGERARDVAVEVYINGLLSSFSTLTLNTLSNTLKVIEGIGERYVAAGIGILRNGARRSIGMAPVDRLTLREANAALFGTIKGLEISLGIPFREMWRAALKGDARGVKKSFVDQAEEGRMFQSFREEAPVMDMRARADIDTHKTIKTLDQGDTFAEAVRTMDFSDIDWNAKAINALGSVIRLPGRLIMTTDELFKNIAYYQDVYARSYREASQFADMAKLTGKERVNNMARYVRESVHDPKKHVHDSAVDYARYQTFQSDLTPGGIGQGFETFLNRHPMFKFVIPFYRTPVNIVKQTIYERTPLPLIFGGQRRLLNQIVNGGAAEGDVALARIAAGSLAIGMGINWAMSGAITGSGSSAGMGYNTETMDDIPPYSVKIGGKWYQYNRLEPLGMLLGLSADLAEGFINWDPDDENMTSQLGEFSALALNVVTTNVTDKTWFRGVADLVQAIDSPDRHAERYINNLTTTLITPYSSLIRRVNTEQDEVAREAWTWVDTWKKNIPGLSEDLAVRRDFLGNERKRTDYLGPAWISPFSVGVENEDPVYQELARLSFTYRMPDRDILNIGVEVSPHVYSEFLRMRGEFARPALLSLIQRQGYADELTDAGRIDRIRNIMNRSTRAARQQLLSENPELRELAIEKRTEAQQLLRQE